MTTWQGAMQSRSKTRWCQFGLASLLWLVLIVALAIHAVQERQQRKVLKARLGVVQGRIAVTEVGTRLELARYVKAEFLWFEPPPQ